MYHTIKEKEMTTTLTDGTKSIEVPTAFLTYCKSRGITEVTDEVMKGWIKSMMKFWRDFDTDQEFREGFLGTLRSMVDN